ncbi:MAG: DUF1343 domain-containing protein, partial [Bacteroidetes bacterium]|nr:DUF1343 domain-containing protein [Bacteroidota bacterium]
MQLNCNCGTMVITGLEQISAKIPARLAGKRVGVLCHAPSITTGFIHISHLLAASRECRLTTVFGPQHGIFGQTQDNMIEWEGYFDEKL